VPEDQQDAAEVRLNRLLNLILETAVDMLGYDAATVTARHDGQLTTVGATDQRLLLLDEAQYESREGPCLEVLDPHDPISWSEEEGDAWQAFREAADQLGVTSSLSLHVPMDNPEDMASSLNLYSRSRLIVAEDQLKGATAFAAQLAAAMQGIDAAKSSARLASGLAEAMRTRAVIEQAKGMLMAEQQINDQEAFQVLTRLSQESNVKLREVAQRLVLARSTGD
jgi:ANTAR domain